jgi:hypothetical protein
MTAGVSVAFGDPLAGRGEVTLGRHGRARELPALRAAGPDGIEAISWGPESAF